MTSSGLGSILASWMRQKQFVFLVGNLAQEEFDLIDFGDEGQGYKLVSFEEFLTSDRVVPQLQERVRDYVEESL